MNPIILPPAHLGMAAGLGKEKKFRIQILKIDLVSHPAFGKGINADYNIIVNTFL